MRKIGYGINCYYRTVSLDVEFVPLWIFILERLTEDICGYLVPPIPLPRIKITREREKTTIREYYGDLRQLFHCYVHDPVFHFCRERIDSKYIQLDYDTARKAFYDMDKKFWDESEKRAAEMRQED